MILPMTFFRPRTSLKRSSRASIRERNILFTMIKSDLVSSSTSHGFEFTEIFESHPNLRSCPRPEIVFSFKLEPTEAER
jgi:hypothetical protein